MFNKLRVTKENIILLGSLLIVAIALIFSIRGYIGNPSIKELSSQRWSFDGPLELSPERGRYALLYSIVENKSVYFSLDVARFATPDLGYYNNKYVSLFAPGVSFIVIPGYILGKLLGASQIGAFSVISFFAILNCLLIFKISKKLGAGTLPAILGFFIFVFGTSAYSYSVSLYQHHISTFLILASIYLLLLDTNLINLGLVWALCALSLSVDYPNLFMMIPIGIIALSRFIVIKSESNKIVMNVKLIYLLSFLFAIIPAILFFWFNKASYGSPTQLAGAVTQARSIDENGLPADTNFTAGLKKDLTVVNNPQVDTSKTRNPVGFFKTREMLNGLYILIFSPDRGVISYSPIILVGIIGSFYLYKRNKNLTVLLVSILTSNIILYTMWGDPWGGWAFGARYLIPGYAILAVFSTFLINDVKKRYFLLPVVILYMYSTYINCIGALTSNAIPPKVEVLELERLSGVEQKYTYKRDFDMIKQNNLKSALFNGFFKSKINGLTYFYAIYGFITVSTVGVFVYYIVNKKND